MKIVFESIDSIKPYAHNPRINDSTIESLKVSLEKFGWQQPIVVDNERVIVVGHSRYRAAQELNLSRVPVLVASELTSDQCRAYRIMDNKSHDWTRWNILDLKFELEDLEDLELTGFNLKELDNILFPELGLIGNNHNHNIKHHVIIECINEEDIELVGKLIEEKGYKNWKKTSY